MQNGLKTAMRRNGPPARPAISAALVALAAMACPAEAQQAPAVEGGIQQETDTSGTNPAVLTRTLSFSNEYRWLGADRFFDQALLRYTEPFLDGKAAVRFTLPYGDTNLVPDDDASGIGDVATKFSWIPYASRHQAFVLSGEVFAPTATEDVLGTGKWVAAPGVTWAWFVSPEVILAPAYIHSLSFAGDEDRADVNRGDFDFYVVYRPKGKKWWLTSDFTVSHDFETDRNANSWEVALGRNLARFGNGAALNGYVRPGIGIGPDRPYDFNVEVGISLVNF